MPLLVHHSSSNATASTSDSDTPDLNGFKVVSNGLTLRDETDDDFFNRIKEKP